MLTPPPSIRFITIREFCARSTLCRASVYKMIGDGGIQKPQKITARRVGWPEPVVDAWFAERGAQA